MAKQANTVVLFYLGTPGRGERNAKYNRLLAIEHEIGVYLG